MRIAARLGRRLRVLLRHLPLVLLTGAVVVVYSEARHEDWAAVRAALARLPVDSLILACLLTALSFAVLTFYDGLGLRFAGRRLSYRRTAFASFISFSVSQSLGFPLVTGIPLRYRLYSGWGLSSHEIRDVLAYYATAFWIGTLGMTGAVLVLDPDRLGALLHLPSGDGRPLGAVMTAASLGYLVWAARRDRHLTLPGLELQAPGLRLALAQLVLGAVDWIVSAGVLYALLPVGRDVLPFPAFVGVFLVSQMAGLISGVPGGLGVFEAVLLTVLRDEISAAAALASLLVYRFLYYLLPLLVALLALGAYEAWVRRQRLERASSVVLRGVSLVVPPAMAVAVFAAGLVLLLSGAVPAADGRLAILERLVPLTVVEISHFLASLVGAFLLVLAWAIQRRIEVAYHITLGLLVAGAALSVTKGLDYEEAAILALMAATLLASGREFYRKSSLLGEPWTPGWGAAVVGAFVAVIGLGILAHEEPLLSSESWWRFEWDAEAPRFLRGTVGALSAACVLAVLKLLSPAVPRLAPPSGSDREAARLLAFASPRTYAQLVLLGDKQLLLDRARSAFVMFGVEGRSWVAMGDPVGSEEGAEELAWTFRALAHKHADWAVFYQIAPARLPLYVDLGLTVTKLGEEARIPLADFSLEGSGRKDLRRTVRSVEKTGATFRVLPPEEVPPVLPRLRQLSDEWLSGKRTREKRFSLGFFDDAYLSRTPVAVLEREARPVAFANIQLGGELHEATVDLIRYGEAAPHSAMEYLLTQSILWAKARGYEWFSLGMAPLSGLDSRPLAPLWTHLGAAIYRHGDAFYHFEGLRAYKQGFDPVWEPRYLASPGGAALPRVLANLAALISGGLGGVVRR